MGVDNCNIAILPNASIAENSLISRTASTIRWEQMALKKVSQAKSS